MDSFRILGMSLLTVINPVVASYSTVSNLKGNVLYAIGDGLIEGPSDYNEFFILLDTNIDPCVLCVHHSAYRFKLKVQHLLRPEHNSECCSMRKHRNRASSV
jgi:hypothetical protein